jgi:hypothetical protein
MFPAQSPSRKNAPDWIHYMTMAVVVAPLAQGSLLAHLPWHQPLPVAACWAGSQQAMSTPE